MKFIGAKCGHEKEGARTCSRKKDRARTFSQKHGDGARTFLPEKGRCEEFFESKMTKTRIK